MQTLTFQNITLTPVKTDSQIWLSSADLAKALGYAQSRAVTKLYNENSDEFNSSMTQVIETTCNNLKRSIRIFSLKGCHLIAMFARTKVAKEFRQWVLDILDKEVTQTQTNAHQRQALVTACDKLAVGNTLRSDVYKMVGNHFGYDDVASIPASLLPDAVAFVYEMIIRLQQQQQIIDAETKEKIKNLVNQTLIYRSWFVAVQKPLGLLNPNIVREMGGITAWNTTIAKMLNSDFDLGIDCDSVLNTNWRSRFIA